MILGEGWAYRFFAELFDLRGTFAPFSRASLSAIAIACFRLVTFLPEPLFSVPFFLRRIVERTFFEAAFPYFAIVVFPSIAICNQYKR